MKDIHPMHIASERGGIKEIDRAVGYIKDYLRGVPRTLLLEPRVWIMKNDELKKRLEICGISVTPVESAYSQSGLKDGRPFVLAGAVDIKERDSFHSFLNTDGYSNIKISSEGGITIIVAMHFGELKATTT